MEPALLSSIYWVNKRIEAQRIIAVAQTAGVKRVIAITLDPGGDA